MSDVSIFDLDGTSINVKDLTARNTADSAALAVGNLTTRVSALENLSRLSVTYTPATETIAFTTTNPTP